MLGGDVAMTLSDGSSSVVSHLAGVDIVVIASLLNTFPYSLISLPEIKKVDQLRGTKIAVSRFGSATDLSVKMALAKVGLNADKMSRCCRSACKPPAMPRCNQKMYRQRSSHRRSHSPPAKPA
jgi:ABC-type nitrate/sulfonate/bicarbonate transport system substrate-binding protein